MLMRESSLEDLWDQLFVIFSFSSAKDYFVNSFTANPIKTVKPIRWIGALLQFDLGVIAIDRVRQGK